MQKYHVERYVRNLCPLSLTSRTLQILDRTTSKPWVTHTYVRKRYNITIDSSIDSDQLVRNDSPKMSGTFAGKGKERETGELDII